MPDWIVWLVFGFVVYKVCIAGSGCHRGLSSARSRGDRALGGGRPAHTAMRRGPARQAETPIQAAQRRFVEGATTVEEYEAEVDRALRQRPSFGDSTAAEPAPPTSRL